MNYEICVIGSESLLFPFLQFGFNTFTPSSEAELRGYIAGAVEKNYGIVYIEDSYCFMVRDILEKYSSALTPIFVPIGESGGEASYSGMMMVRMMERAVGRNVL